jgi:hypothetical protein
MKNQSVNPTEIFVVRSWSQDEDYSERFFVVCATRQLAEQVLDSKGGHSFGWVRCMRVVTTMREAMYQ